MPKSPIRPIRIEGNIAYVPLTRGYEAIIDAADVSLVDGFNWYATTGKYSIYAARDNRAGGRRETVLMHRVIAQTPLGMHTDHINRDGLDNRLSNLRAATQSENIRNQGVRRNNKSGLKGASWHTTANRWVAKIKLDKKQFHLGFYDTAEEAHRAYCEASERLHGKFGGT
jgi:hypothetical protein